MNMARSIRTKIPLAGGAGNTVREGWDRLAKLPGGQRLFSRLVGTAAPYTGSIDGQVVELRRGYSRVLLRDRRKVRNHLNCVHAIALANLAELCGNVALAYSMPDDARFIVAGLSMEYIKKARGTITAECHCPIPETNERQEYEVIVEMKDDAGELVTRCTLQTLVGPRKA
jgi:acyl-coenzyme A thioesterase PaaI-like protein